MSKTRISPLIFALAFVAGFFLVGGTAEAAVCQTIGGAPYTCTDEQCQNADNVTYTCDLDLGNQTPRTPPTPDPNDPDYVPPYLDPRYDGAPGGYGATGSSTASAPVAKPAAQSQNTWDPLQCALAANWGTCLMWLVSTLLGELIALFIGVAGWLLVRAIDFNLAITQLPIIIIGHRVLLAFVNMGFVIGGVVIAISTMLRIESYGMKQLLWKFLVMAVVINFSLTIAVTIVNFSNDLGVWVLSQAMGADLSPKEFGNHIAKVLTPQELLNGPPNLKGLSAVEADPNATAWDRFVDLAGNLWGNFTLDAFARYSAGLMHMAFTSIFGFVVAVTLGAFAALLIVRFVELSYLLMFAAPAFFGGVFPGTEKYSSDWWHRLLSKSFFFPFCMFLMYLAILGVELRYRPVSPAGQTASDGRGTSMLAALQNDAPPQSEDEEDEEDLVVGGEGQNYFSRYTRVSENVQDNPEVAIMTITGNVNIVQNGIERVFLIFFMFGALYVANKMGVTGAKAAYGAATAGTKAFANAMWQSPAKAAGRYLTTPKVSLPPNATTGQRIRRFIGNPLQGILAPKGMTRSAPAGASSSGGGGATATTEAPHPTPPPVAPPHAPAPAAPAHDEEGDALKKEAEEKRAAAEKAKAYASSQLIVGTPAESAAKDAAAEAEREAHEAEERARSHRPASGGGSGDHPAPAAPAAPEAHPAPAHAPTSAQTPSHDKHDEKKEKEGEGRLTPLFEERLITALGRVTKGLIGLPFRIANATLGIGGGKGGWRQAMFDWSHKRTGIAGGVIDAMRKGTHVPHGPHFDAKTQKELLHALGIHVDHDAGHGGGEKKGGDAHGAHS